METLCNGGNSFGVRTKSLLRPPRNTRSKNHDGASVKPDNIGRRSGRKRSKVEVLNLDAPVKVAILKRRKKSNKLTNGEVDLQKVDYVTTLPNGIDPPYSERGRNKKSAVKLDRRKKRVIEKDIQTAVKIKKVTKKASYPENCVRFKRCSKKSSSTSSVNSDVGANGVSIVKIEGNDVFKQCTNFDGQYVGIQPSIKFKCFKCGEDTFKSINTLQQHVKMCIGDRVLTPTTFSKRESSQTNLRIVRRVFLCTACRTYYQDWDMYIHIKDVHDKQVCLLCLVMFNDVSDLWDHVKSEHGARVKVFSNKLEICSSINDPFFVACCACNSVFSQDEDFVNHTCAANRQSMQKSVTVPNGHIMESDCSEENDFLGNAAAFCHVALGNREKSSADKILSESKSKTENGKAKKQKEPKSKKNDKLNSTVEISKKRKRQDAAGTKTEDAEFDSNATLNKKPKFLFPRVTDKSPSSSKEVVEESSELNDSQKCPEQEPEMEEPPKPDIDVHTSAESRDEEEKDDEAEELNQLENFPAMALTLDDKIETVSIRTLIKECLKTSCNSCLYCFNAMYIATNCNQLATHLRQSHKYMPTKHEDKWQDVFRKLKNSLEGLEQVYINADSFDSTDASCHVPFKHTYVCFQCDFTSDKQKELYLHKRKMHLKNFFICFMCRNNFGNYSELMCHMCHGVTGVPIGFLHYRCCYCGLFPITSSFRLMVHMRKAHHSCNICLEETGDQQKLYIHVMKHKVHHLCYKCGIAYRSKSDINKHLFWKHGAEGVLCKKCLQKKWPYIYHFCSLFPVYACEECNLEFSKPVALTVHKRLHASEYPFRCDECDAKFISKKLLRKHKLIHQPTAPSTSELVTEAGDSTAEGAEVSMLADGEKENHDRRFSSYDLPPLNLSSSDSEDDDDDDSRIADLKEDTKVEDTSPNIDDVKIDSVTKNDDAIETDVEKDLGNNEEIAGVTKNDNTVETAVEEKNLGDNKEIVDVSEQFEQVMMDSKPNFDYIKLEHDYCCISEESGLTYEDGTPPDVENVGALNSSDNVSRTPERGENSLSSFEQSPSKESNGKSPKFKTSSDDNSSTDDDDESSSSSCDSECSCSHSTSVSTDTSNDSDEKQKYKEKRRKKRRRRKRKEKRDKEMKKLEENDISGKNNTSVEEENEIVKYSRTIIESDLDTDLSSMGEDFYAEKPYAVQLPVPENLQEVIDGREEEPEHKIKKKKYTKKMKKSKKDKNDSSMEKSQPPESDHRELPAEVLKSSPCTPVLLQDAPASMELKDGSRQSKRKRTKNKFYGYSSSDEEPAEAKQPPKVKKLTIKTQPPPPPRPLIFQKPPHTGLRVLMPVVRQDPKPNPLPYSRPVYPPPSPKMSLPVPPSPAASWQYRPGPSHPFQLGQRLLQQRLAAMRDSPVDGFTSPPPYAVGPRNRFPTPRINEPRKVNPLYINVSTGVSKTVPNVESNVLPEDDDSQTPASIRIPPPPGPSAGGRNEKDNLYCYCQCPYDEVSEMIACDGPNCKIEWFHFECVGIMVPPKGRWYCPSCRKADDARYG